MIRVTQRFIRTFAINGSSFVMFLGIDMKVRRRTLESTYAHSKTEVCFELRLQLITAI